MPYTLIKGSYHIFYPEHPKSGPEPDGDTLKFQPDNRDLIENLPRANKPPRFTKNGITTIRFEGIDALETHYPIEGEEYHQRMDLAIKARDVLLELAGFGAITFWEDKPNKVKSVEHHPVRGYILSNGLDTFGRTIAFVFIGDHKDVDGSRIFVQPYMIDRSLNVMMLTRGHAYPAFYLTLPAELRKHCRGIVETAKREAAGLWKYDTITHNNGEKVLDITHLQERVMWPKIFRRLAAFYQDGHTDLDDLDTWLREDPVDRDDRVLFPNLELGNMHDLIVVKDNIVSLSHFPEDIVIVPDDYILPERPDIPVHTGPGNVRIVAALINPKEHPEYGHETVTILNTTDTDIDLVNWHIADRNGKQELGGVLKRGTVRQVVLGGSVRLNNEMDTITILDDQNNIVDQVSYEKKQAPGEGFTKIL